MWISTKFLTTKVAVLDRNKIQGMRYLAEFTKNTNTLWQADRFVKSPRKRNSLYFINSLAYYSTNLKSSRPTKAKMIIERKIMSLETVQEQLKFFVEVKYLAETVNKIAILYNIAKIIERDEEQKEVLKQQHSTYMELLDSISDQMARCLPQNVPIIMWALGINQVKHQKLFSLCEKKLLSCGALVFDNENLCQILSGCANLNMSQTKIFPKFQEAILNGEVKICDFENHQLSGILLSFAKTNNGSVDFFDAFLEEILSRDLAVINSHALAEFVWSFAKKELEVDKLFDRVEEEILRRGTTDLNKTDFIAKVLWAFGKADKGSKQFYDSVDNELVSVGVERFSNVQLLNVVWSFARRNFTKAIAFDLVKKELLKRGAHTLQTHELVLFLLSFFSAQRQDDKLVTEIESELCLRNGKQIGSTQLCQVAWSLGRTGKSQSKLFDVIEAEVFQRGVCHFSKEEKFILMRGFIEARRGSKKFYELLYSSFSEKDFSNFSARDICEFVLCFSEANVQPEAVFDALEKEILNKEKDYFSQKQLTSIKKSCQKVGKGTKELFEL
ncbi:hypothetical protein ACROYT_G040545 [Oculina patagonica]